jgi:hypothetical protein
MNKLGKILTIGFGLGVLAIVLTLISNHTVKAAGPPGAPITLAYNTTLNCYEQVLYTGVLVDSCYEIPQNGYLVVTDISFEMSGCTGTGALVSLHTPGGNDVWRAALVVDAGGDLYTQTHFTTGTVFTIMPVSGVALSGSCTSGTTILTQGFASPAPTLPPFGWFSGL